MSLIALFLAVLIGLGSGASDATTSDGSAADGDAAQATIRQVVNAVESCAATRLDGTYGPANANGDDCLAPATVQDFESGLAKLDLARTVPGPGAYQLAPVGTEGTGYLVQAATDGGYFVEIHRPDGNLFRFCGPAPFTAASTSATAGVRDLDGCAEDGTW